MDYGKIKSKLTHFLRNPYNLFFLVLLLFMVLTYGKHLFIDSIWLDETAYMWDAQLIKQNPLHLFEIVGNLYHFPVLIITIFNLFFKSFIAGRLMGLFFSLVGVITIYIYGKKIGNSYVGVLAASFLIVDWWYRFLSLKALIDVPVTAMILLYSLTLCNFEMEKTLKSFIVLALVGLATIFSKMSGLFVLPLTAGYFAVLFIFFKKKRTEYVDIIKRNKKTSIALIVLPFLLFMLFFKHLKGFFIQSSFEYFIPTVKSITGLLPMPIIILAIFGIIVTILYKQKDYVLLVTGGLLFLFFLSILWGVGVPELRYTLPIITYAYLLAAIVINEVLNLIVIFTNTKKYKLVFQAGLYILLFFLILQPGLAKGKEMVESRRESYSGYIEAMHWVHENIPPSGERIISNFHGCCSYNVGLMDKGDYRRINHTYHFETFDDFKVAMHKDNETATYIMIDIWEPGQRSWLFPLPFYKLHNPQTGQSMLQLDFEQFPKIQNIKSLGFKVVKVTKRPAPLPVIDVTTQQMIGREVISDVPVNIIFKRN